VRAINEAKHNSKNVNHKSTCKEGHAWWCTLCSMLARENGSDGRKRYPRIPVKNALWMYVQLW